MKPRHAPAAATWFLKLVCSSAEHESVTGDLLEQYQRGRGRLWYWRQVLAIVFAALCEKVVRRPLLRTNKSLIGRGFAAGIVIAGLSAIALSDIWPILIVGILGGVFAGILKFGYDNAREDTDYSRNTRDSRGESFTLLPSTPPGPTPGPGSAQTKTEPTYSFQRTRASGGSEIPMNLHRGINSSSIAGEGFEGLPGLLMMIAFVFIFLGLFMPRRADWFGGLFFIVEIGAAALYLLLGRHNRKDSERFQKTLHQINEPQDRTNGSPTHVK